MDLPTSSSPIASTAGICVLCCVAVLLVQHHPADYYNFVSRQRFLQIGGGPILSFRTHDRALSRCYLNNHVMDVLRVARVQCQLNMSVSVVWIRCLTINRFCAARFHSYHISSDDGTLGRVPASNIISWCEYGFQGNVGINLCTQRCCRAILQTI